MATARWVRYNVEDEGDTYLGGSTASGLGTRGFSEARTNVSGTFNIGPTTDKLFINVDGDSGAYITLSSGVDLDPRFVAKEITEKVQALSRPGYPGYNYVQCVWSNDEIGRAHV